MLGRYDGIRVKDEHTLRKLMPYLMPKRNEAAIYFEQLIDVEPVLNYLQTRKESGQENDITFFQVVLTAMLRAASRWPKMNRFICGKKIYQRHKIALSFAVKKKMQEDANMTAVKIEFDGPESVFDTVGRINQRIDEGRSKKKTQSEKEMAIVDYLPGFVIRFIFWLQRSLDGVGLLPASMTRNDPLYTTIFVANLGSVGLEAPFHHLFEYGTAPLFGVIGRIHLAPMVDDNGQVVAKKVVRIRWSFDERITDGFYCAKALGDFERFLKDPKQLEERDLPA